ncbi:TPA: nucleoid-associated protein [Streptococcus suis]|nr:nucleoid-associated protein [Streptococcus suis]
MRKDVAVYEITDSVNEVELTTEKVRNIAEIFDTIIGESGKKATHSKIRAEIIDDNSILAKFSKENNFDIERFAHKLLDSERAESTGKRSKGIREGFLFVQIHNGTLTLLKLEKTSVADKETFKLDSQLGTDKHYYKACLYLGDLHNIAIIDKSKKVASYWLNDFLGLKEFRNDKVNTLELIELVENKQLFSETVRNLPEINEIVSETKNYIFESAQFDKTELLGRLTVAKLLDLDLSLPDVESVVYSTESSELDANFMISQDALKEKYHKTITISDTTVLKTHNLEKLQRQQLIKLVGNELMLKVPNDYIAEVKKDLGI